MVAMTVARPRAEGSQDHSQQILHRTMRLPQSHPLMPQTTTCHFRRDTNDKARTVCAGFFYLNTNVMSNLLDRGSKSCRDDDFH